MELEQEVEAAVVLDTETTGLDLNTAAICQIAAVGVMPAEENDFTTALTGMTLLSTLLNPGCPIPEEAAAIHKVTDAKVRLAVPERLGIEMLAAQIDRAARAKERVYLLSYNGDRYDLPLIERRARGHGLVGEEKPNVWELPHIDLFPLVQRLDPTGRHKLAEAWEDMMDMPSMDAHDAAADCYMVIDILAAIMGITGYKTLRELHEWSQEAIPYTLMPFGKHKGLPVEKIPSGYWSWMYRNTEPADMSRDLRATLLKVLGKGGRDET